MYDLSIDRRATGINAELHAGRRHLPGAPGGALLVGLLSALIDQRIGQQAAGDQFRPKLNPNVRPKPWWMSWSVHQRVCHRDTRQRQAIGP